MACARILLLTCNLRDNSDLCAIGLPLREAWRSLGSIRKKGKFHTVLMIRLARVGARKKPYYRVVVIDKERARNGRSVEVVGTYNPRTNPATVDLKRDRIEHWVSKGAQMSETVNRLFSKTPATTETAA